MDRNEKNVYLIPEDNFLRLEREVNKIIKKCEKYNTEFVFEKLGEEFHDVVVNDVSFKAKFYKVKAFGIARAGDYSLVAELTHLQNGNIIKKFASDAPVLQKYWHGTGKCDCCNINRSRTKTYIVFNNKTKEYSQVGKSCLKEHTNGLSLDQVALYNSFFDEVNEAINIHFDGIKHYVDVKKAISVAYMCVKTYGYVKSDREDGTKPTKLKTKEILNLLSGRVNVKEMDFLKKEYSDMESKYKEESKAFAENAIKWLDTILPRTEYLHNIKLLGCSDYVSEKELGYVVSIVPTYLNYLNKLEKDKNNKSKSVGEFVGEIGERIDISNVKDFKLITSWANDYGYTFVYGFSDLAGNDYVWKASGMLDFDNKTSYISSIKGTVKKHEEYRGKKQTVLTRCKVTLKEKEEAVCLSI